LVSFTFETDTKPDLTVLTDPDIAGAGVRTLLSFLSLEDSGAVFAVYVCEVAKLYAHLTPI
jgi:hypothetical protein